MTKLLILAPLALAACNAGPTVDVHNASVQEVQEKVAANGATRFLAPGRWEGTTAITDMQVPGMPPQMAARMKSEMGEGHAFVSCLTEEEAKKPAASFFSGKGSECRYDHFTMSGGKIDAAMTCKGAQGRKAPVAATMNGGYSSDRFQMTMTSKSPGSPAQPMSAFAMTMKMDARNTGACKGDEKS